MSNNLKALFISINHFEQSTWKRNKNQKNIQIEAASPTHNFSSKSPYIPTIGSHFPRTPITLS